MMGEDFLFGGLRLGSGLVSPWRAGALSLIKSLVGENLARETGLGKGRARPAGRALGVVSRGVAESRPGRISSLGAAYALFSQGRAGWASQVPRSGWSPHSPEQAQGHANRTEASSTSRPPGPRYGAILLRTLFRDSPVQSPSIP